MVGPGSLFAIPQPDREPLGVGVLWGLFKPSVSPAGGAGMVGMWQACQTCPLGGHPLLVSWFIDSETLLRVRIWGAKQDLLQSLPPALQKLQV